MTNEAYGPTPAAFGGPVRQSIQGSFDEDDDDDVFGLFVVGLVGWRW